MRKIEKIIKSYKNHCPILLSSTPSAYSFLFIIVTITIMIIALQQYLIAQLKMLVFAVVAAIIMTDMIAVAAMPMSIYIESFFIIVIVIVNIFHHIGC